MSMSEELYLYLKAAFKNKFHLSDKEIWPAFLLPPYTDNLYLSMVFQGQGLVI